MSLFRRHRRIPLNDLEFFLLWLRRPGRMGAVMPSSRALAAAMADKIDTALPGLVVELGGGTGNVTSAILDAGVAAEDLIVVEREARLCRTIRARFPGIRVLHGDARELAALLQRADDGPVKAVVSGLPLVSMDSEDCRRILSQAFRILGETGEFVQFTYMPASPVSRRIRAALGLSGRRAERILNNVPPATVWCYRRDFAERDLSQVA